MTADLFSPHIGAEGDAPAAAPELCIPPWVPKPVALVAREEYAVAIGKLTSESTLDAKEFPIPLVCDRRMRRVWHELSRRKKDGTFMRPAATSIEASNAEERQNKAMIMLLRAVLNYAIRPGYTMTRRQADRISTSYLWKACDLRVEAAMLDAAETLTHGGERATAKSRDRTRRLLDAAQAYEEYARDTYPYNMRWALDRDSGDRGGRWFALKVADIFRTLFGSPMYGLTAIIMSVVLGREVTRSSIRALCD